MENKALLEEIKRIHEIIGVDSKFILEDTQSVNEGPIPGTSKAAQYLAKILVSDIIEHGGRTYTRKEVRAIMNKVGLRALSKDESAIVKKATAKFIAKDASKSVLDTIAKTFVSDLKSITDNAIAEAEFQEFKLTLRSVLTDADANVLEKNIKEEMANIVRPVRPIDLDVIEFEKFAKTIDTTKIKDFSKVTDKLIATYRSENPTLNTTQLVKKILDDCPDKTWTREFIIKNMGAAFDWSTTKGGEFARFALEIARKIPFGAVLKGSGVALLLYAAAKGIEAYGKKHNVEYFKEDIEKIVTKYPCLGDSNGNPKWITPGEDTDEYILKDKNEVEYPAIWKDNILYYVDKKTKKITQPVSC